MPDLQPTANAVSRICVDDSAPARGTLSLFSGRGSGEARSLAPRAVIGTRGAATATQRAASSATVVDTVPLQRLTAGRKAVKIAHAGETYLLRITKANKLILTKPATDEKPPADAKV